MLETRNKWEIEVERSVAWTNSMVKYKSIIVYARFKWFKCDICRLVLVDTGNLVKSILVSKEFWDRREGNSEVGFQSRNCREGRKGS